MRCTASSKQISHLKNKEYKTKPHDKESKKCEGLSKSITTGHPACMCLKERTAMIPLGPHAGDKSGRKLLSLTPWAYSLPAQMPQNCKVIGGGHGVGELEKEKKQKEEVSEQEIQNSDALQIRKISINGIAHPGPLTASVMEHESIMGIFPFAWLEKNHQTLRHYYDVCVS